MDFEIKKKGKHVKAEEFVKEMKEIYEKANVALKKSQEEMMRDRQMKKLIEKFVGPYKIKKITSENAVELELLVSMKIHLVVNISRIAMYQKQVERWKKIPSLSVEIDREKEYEVRKILNRRDVRGKSKYLVRWKEYTAEKNTWEGLENLENAMD